MNREAWQVTVHGVTKRAVNNTQLCMKSLRGRAHSPFRGHFSDKTCPQNQATLMLAQNSSNRAAHLEEFNYQTKEDQEILHSLHRESSCQGMRGRGPALWLREVPEMSGYHRFLMLTLNTILCICI